MYGDTRWAIGFVRGGMSSLMEGDCLAVDWVKMPKDRWYADPFVLDVIDDEILLLVEDYSHTSRKGIISLLHINRATMEITARKELLNLPTHLSFPAILRKNGHVYVYPESAHSGRLDMYEYHADSETLSFVKTICNDVVWDSYITESFGDSYLFTAACNDYQLDIYRWNIDGECYLPYQVIPSAKPNSRLGGAIYEYKGAYYYPAQDCSRNYGCAIDVKRIDYVNGKFDVTAIKHLVSPHPDYQLGMHTINEYKGVTVIDVYGYRYGWIGALIAKIVKLKKNLKYGKKR